MDVEPTGSGLYNKWLSEYTLLQPAEERALFEKVESLKVQLTGSDDDFKAKGELEALLNSAVKSNLRLVLFWVRKFINRGIPYDDLIQDGNLALIRAVRTFDSGLGYKLSTYASRCIFNELLNATRPSVVNPMKEMVSLDEPVGEEEDSTLLDFIPDDVDVERKALLLSLPQAMDNALLMLSARDREVLELRSGRSGDKPMTLEEVAEHYGVTREAIRQREIRALRKLRHSEAPVIKELEGIHQLLTE